MRFFQRRFPELRNLPDEQGYMLYMTAKDAARGTTRLKVAQLVNLIIILIAAVLLANAVAVIDGSSWNPGLSPALLGALALTTWLGLCWFLSRMFDHLVIRPHVRHLVPHLCPRCSYDLTGNVSRVCPECGAPVGPWATRLQN